MTDEHTPTLNAAQTALKIVHDSRSDAYSHEFCKWTSTVLNEAVNEHAQLKADVEKIREDIIDIIIEADANSKNVNIYTPKRHVWEEILHKLRALLAEINERYPIDD
jgi:hypothetical protein